MQLFQAVVWSMNVSSVFLYLCIDVYTGHTAAGQWVIPCDANETIAFKFGYVELLPDRAIILNTFIAGKLS